MQQGGVLVTPESCVVRGHVVIFDVQPLPHYLVNDGHLYLGDAILVDDFEVKATFEPGFEAFAGLIAIVGRQRPGTGESLPEEILPVAVLVLDGFRGNQRLATGGAPPHGVHLVRAQTHPEIFRAVRAEALVAQLGLVADYLHDSGHPEGVGEGIGGTVAIRILHLHLHAHHYVFPDVGHGGVLETRDWSCHEVLVVQLIVPIERIG